MDKNLLTQEIISGCIVGTDGGDQNHKIVKVLAIVMFAVGAIGLLFPIITLICWGIGILCLVLNAKSKQIVQSVEKREYLLRADICTNKGTSTSVDGPDSKYLSFEKSGRVEANFPYAIWNSQAVTKTPDLYGSTQIGDGVYLLCMTNGRVLYIFNQRYWQINQEEFTENEDKYFLV